MKNYILATVMGAIILFVWNIISWMVLPFHGDMLNTLPESAVNALKSEKNPVESGIYHYPGLNDPDLFRKVQEGPRIPFLVYIAEGTSAFDPLDFVKSLLFNLLTASLILVVLTKLSNRSTNNAILVALVLALLVGFASEFPKTSWFKFPVEYALVNILDYVVGFALASWAMSKMAFRR